MRAQPAKKSGAGVSPLAGPGPREATIDEIVRMRIGRYTAAVALGHSEYSMTKRNRSA